MKLVERFWAALTCVLNFLTFPPVGYDAGIRQYPLVKDLKEPYLDPLEAPGPIFKPPGGAVKGDGSEFVCNYTLMYGWEECSTPDNRGCWLKHPTLGEIGINTDYESFVPTGIVRQYSLTIGAGAYNADGQNFTAAKLFNNSYPGPWIQACWGDQVKVTVTVDPTFPNGTAVHWHGIRQYQTMHMDGVPGISQCPIAPGSTFLYNWTATQYGSSWYHSHYSLQYADGMLGPLTLHGPSTANYDEAGKLPLLITDWDHASAFNVIYNHSLSDHPSILLNGQGDVSRCNPGVKPDRRITLTTVTLDQGKRYLLRVINTAYDSTFLFTIDHHLLTVVSADFVPIVPYTTNSILVGIGQRYNIIVETNPLTNETNLIPPDHNFWIRAFFVSDCFGRAPRGRKYNEVGILRYNAKSTAAPTSHEWADLDKKTCEGETGWKPWYPWIVGANEKLQQHDVQFLPSSVTTDYPLAAFAITTPTPTPVTFAPLHVDYGNITFRNLDNAGTWPDPWVIVAEEGTADEWVYLVLTASAVSPTKAHPIHLHGHDFAVIAQERNKKYDAETVILNLQNPPRRDVVLLPSSGYVVIAFKTDNPGAWLMHCHIARHASAGLALQILEDREQAAQIWQKNGSQALDNAAALCADWDTWVEDCTHRWNHTCDEWFPDDSGI
ncbi:laccase-like multicopper oxidase [Glonium stellatum]|uniref:Laccase-like multicopper oxidase n=1 Tax=Glonium stellatum TaxID=574774 RepID=A0A8E2JSV1_9PEZI|nr:laccase-like multicopper oxidase [Glonium stellatum]